MKVSNAAIEEKAQSGLTKASDWGKKIVTWFGRWPLAFLIALLVIAGFAIALALGVGDRFNWGGILGKLFGQEDPQEDRVVVANKTPEERVDSEGKQIPKGEADEHGMVQREVEVLEQPKNPFRDKTKLTIKDAETGEEKKLKLPKGVEDTDVDKVVEIRPKVYKIEVKKRPEGRANDDLLDALEG